MSQSSPALDRIEDCLTAYHESGHAVVGRALGMRLRSVTMGDGGDDAFAWFFDPPRDPREHRPSAARNVAMLWGGPLAEFRQAKRLVRAGSAEFPLLHSAEDCLSPSDARRIGQLCHRHAHGDWHRFEQLRMRWKRRAKELVILHWPEIAALAQLLVERRKVGGAEIADFLSNLKPKPEAA